jgi:pyruvate kinase
MPYAQLPSVQRHLLCQAARHGKPAIVATHFLESLSNWRVPLRAEIIDIAATVREGASAILLTGETRTGRAPVYAVEALAQIIDEAERSDPA